MNSTFKAPGAKRLFTLDWSADLGEKTIVSSAWTLPEGLTLEAEGKTDTTALALISGGTTGVVYEAKNHIVMSSGEEDEDILHITVQPHP